MKMIIRVFICLSILCGCISNKSSDKIEKITIKKVNFNIETAISVGCEDFEQYFETKIIEKVFFGEDLTEDLQKIFFKTDFKKSSYIPDVRSKVIILFSDGRKMTICLSSLGMLIDNEPYDLDNEIFNFVNKY